MTYMVKAQIMQHHGVPILIEKFSRYVPRHVIVHFSKVLNDISLYLPNLGQLVAYCNKETGRSVRTVEKAGK